MPYHIRRIFILCIILLYALEWTVNVENKSYQYLVSRIYLCTIAYNFQLFDHATFKYRFRKHRLTRFALWRHLASMLSKSKRQE